MTRYLFVFTFCCAIVGCGWLKMPGPADDSIPPAPIRVEGDAAVCGQDYLNSVADAFDAHAANLEGTVAEDVSLKQMRKSLTAAPEGAFLPLMKEIQAVPKGDTQRRDRAALSRAYAKQLRGGR